MENDDLPLTRQERIGVIAFGVFLAAFGTLWAIAATGIATRNTYQAITPDFVPFWAGVILATAGLALAYTNWRKTPIADDPVEPLFILSEQIRVVAFLAVLLAYCLLLETIHYFWLTLVTMLLALIAAREPIGPWLVIKAVATAALMFLTFIIWFSVPLPGSRFF
jgi:hypothetical protein